MNNITYFAVCITIANWWFSSLWQIFFQSSGQNSYFQLQLHGYLSHHLSLQGLPDLSLRINELNSPAKIKYKRWPMTPALIDLERVFHTPTGNLWKKNEVSKVLSCSHSSTEHGSFYKTHREGPLQRMRPINWLRSSAFKRSGTQRVEVISTKPKSRGSWQV